jgi:hypothetical protein
MIRRNLVIAAALFCIAAMENSAQTRRVPVIRQVDHILIESSDPKALFRFFSETLQLPAAWPISENQRFITGGIGAGNVNLELFRYTERKENPSPGVPQAHYSGIAFEPYALADSLRELQLRGIPHNQPEPVVSRLPNGSSGTAWTTVGLSSFSKPGMSVFLYEYSQAFLKVDVRRKQLANRLTLDNGGPLGLLSVDEILITSANLKKDNENWGILLGNITPSGNRRAGAGPAIRLAEGNQDGIREIIVGVNSLDRAKAFLAKNKLMGPVSAKGILLNPAKVQGLRILLRAKKHL